MGTCRVLVFRSLLSIVIVLMAISFLGGPWWTGEISPAGPEEGVWIYPHAFTYNLEGMSAQYIVDVDVPGFINVVPWVYLALVAGAIIYSSWKLKGKAGRWLIGLVGFSYLFYAAFFIFYANMRMAEYDIPLSGRAEVIGDPIGVYVTGIINWGYYLACCVGLLFIGLALLRDKIIGKPKLNM